jgi:hypothetical protein
MSCHLTHFSAYFFALYQLITNFEKKYSKKVKKSNLKKNRVLDFSVKTGFGPPGGRVNIMADGNFLASYLKIGVDNEFDIETARFNYTSFQNVRFLQKLTLNQLKLVKYIPLGEEKVRLDDEAGWIGEMQKMGLAGQANFLILYI